MNIEIEPIGRCTELRNAFIHKFVRTSPNEYHEHIEKTILKNNLPYYSGFLWEFMYFKGEMNAELISEEEGLQLLSTKDTVLIMFDFFFYQDDQHQRPKILPFERSDWQHLIYRAKANCLPKLIWESWNGDPKKINTTEDGPIALPESVYVFDETLTWYIAFTEENDGQERICITSSD